MTNNLIIWWSSWDFYRVDPIRNTDEVIKKYFVGEYVSAIEIMFNWWKISECSISRETLENKFSYCSIHAPMYAYQDDEESHKILKYLEKLCFELPIKNMVFHPNPVLDWAFFDQYKNLPLSIENMDDRKTSFRWVEDIKKILDKYPYFNFTLDLQHCFVNDPTMQLSKDFHEAFWDRLVEYHISWFHPDYLHHPLYLTKQDQIIQALQNQNIPIIIESGFDEKDWLKKEIQYISNIINF